MYTVYVKTDDRQRIVAIDSSAFLQDASGWVKIDEGVGDKYHHAQGNYLPGPISDERGICRYKIIDDQIIERTQEEIDADWIVPPQQYSIEDKVNAIWGAIEIGFTL